MESRAALVRSPHRRVGVCRLDDARTAHPFLPVFVQGEDDRLEVIERESTDMAARIRQGLEPPRPMAGGIPRTAFMSLTLPGHRRAAGIDRRTARAKVDQRRF